MNYIENLFVNVDKAWRDEERTWCVKLEPLLLLQKFNLLLWWYFLISIFRVLFIEILAHFSAHLLQLYFDFLPFLFNHLLKFFIIVGFLSESDSFQWIAIKLKELKSQLYVNADMAQIVDNNFLDIEVFKSIRISNELRLVFNTLLIGFELLCSSSIAAWTNVVYALWSYPTWNQPIDESYCMGSPTINCDVLRFFLSLKQTNVVWFFSKMLVQVRVINRINAIDEVLILVIRRVHKSTTDQAFILK